MALSIYKQQNPTRIIRNKPFLTILAIATLDPLKKLVKDSQDFSSLMPPLCSINETNGSSGWSGPHPDHKDFPVWRRQPGGETPHAGRDRSMEGTIRCFVQIGHAA